MVNEEHTRVSEIDATVVNEWTLDTSSQYFM